MKTIQVMIKDQRKPERGFTLAEVLVVIVILVVIVALAMASLQRMREMSRRSMFQRNLVELSLALSMYHNAHLHYPAGSLNPSGPIRSIEDGYHHNWIAALLPTLGADEVAEQIAVRTGNEIAKKSDISLQTEVFAGFIGRSSPTRYWGVFGDEPDSAILCDNLLAGSHGRSRTLAVPPYSVGILSCHVARTSRKSC